MRQTNDFKLVRNVLLTVIVIIVIIVIIASITF